MRKINLQLFDDAQPVAARSYAKDFKELLQAVFENQSYFADFFGGSIEALDGIQNKDVAFSVKTSDIPVVVGTYSTDANTAMGTGTGSSSRFGNRTEIIYADTDVRYTWDWNFHEGIDRHTVNNDLDAAVADRLELQARAKTTKFNQQHSAFISASAAKSIAAGTLSEASVLKAFKDLAIYFAEIGSVGTKKAKVSPEVYNYLVDSANATSSKGSSVSMDENGLMKYKGFVIEEVPSAVLQKNECIYAYVEAVGKAFTGIETARTIESEDFDGVALQGCGKAGEYILPANKPAVAKVTYTPAA